MKLFYRKRGKKCQFYKGLRGVYRQRKVDRHLSVKIRAKRNILKWETKNNYKHKFLLYHRNIKKSKYFFENR